jgi:hypothetical protein
VTLFLSARGRRWFRRGSRPLIVIPAGRIVLGGEPAGDLADPEFRERLGADLARVSKQLADREEPT